MIKLRYDPGVERIVALTVALFCLIGCSQGSTSDGGAVVASPPPTVSFSADPISVTNGESSMLTWSSTNATTCAATGAWSGSKPASGESSTDALTGAINTFVLTCSGNGGSASDSVTVTVVDPPVAATTVTLSADPMTVSSGNSAMLTWSSTNATSCNASGAWSGNKPISGSVSTGALTEATNVFALECTGSGGVADNSATVTVMDTGAVFGLDFQGSASTTNTVRFVFTKPLDIFPATYIWKARPRQQRGYYTAFFWGNDDGKGDLSTFLWDSNGDADSYYGAHPYPKNPPDGNTHDWEISVEQEDPVNGTVVYDRWHTQALRVWADADGNKHHEFYWDLPNTDSSHMVRRVSPPDWGNKTPPSPALTWGDAPWAPSQEIWNGVMRGIQIYSTNLSLEDITKETDQPLSTATGAANIWYMNINPTPTDISDKSGTGNNPAWVGNERPLLWSGQ